MKIALLNLLYDNNYGGNLQRFALVYVLQSKGYEVIHLNLRYNFYSGSFFCRIKLLLKRIRYILLNKKLIELFPEKQERNKYRQLCRITEPFYNKYIPHTKEITTKEQLEKYNMFDAYIVGSDQVWRKYYTREYGLSTFFFDFLQSLTSIKRVAYGVSFGSDTNKLTLEEVIALKSLYKKFDYTSVREDSALKLLSLYGWISPKAELVLDPTLLLSKEDYCTLLNCSITVQSAGNLFCYILDTHDGINEIIKDISQKNNLIPFFAGVDGNTKFSVEQWIRSFFDSEYIVTDSFHGVVFSIIFNKPFKVILNEKRGKSRFESLFRVLSIPEDTERIDYQIVNERISQLKDYSIKFLVNALKESKE